MGNTNTNPKDNDLIRNIYMSARLFPKHNYLTRITYTAPKLFPEQCIEVHPTPFNRESILSEIENCKDCLFRETDMEIMRTIINTCDTFDNKILLSKHDGILIHTNTEPVLRIYNGENSHEKEDPKTGTWMGIHL